MDSLISVIASCVVWDVKSLLLFIVIFIVTTDYIKNRQPHSFPPGPPAIPILGNIFNLDYQRGHESMTQLAKKYGDVYSMRMGQVWLVVINGFGAVKEALVHQKDSVVDRPPLPLVIRLTDGKGLLLSSGNHWKQQRRFALTTLRNFGLGKKRAEQVILHEFTHCAKDFSSYKGKPFDPHLTTNKAVGNIICTLVFGHRFEYHNKDFTKLMTAFGKGLHIQASIWAQFYNAFPFVMRYLPGPHQTVQHMWKDIKKFIREQIEQHRQDWDPSDQRDYIDCFLNEMEMNKGHAEDEGFDGENLVLCVMDLFMAGSETTSSTLRWAFLYMAKYPEIQAKVQAEIDEVIGQSRHVSMEDRANLPYTDAVVHEIQRMSNVIPLGFPHLTNKELQLDGYTIPKGITIIPNLTSVLFDKREWKTPYTFNPGHFLNEEGKFVKPAAFIPFSAGKRQCAGESLAKMELFLFFTSFMQHFTFSMPAGVKPPMDFYFGITLPPRQYKICINSRSE